MAPTEQTEQLTPADLREAWALLEPSDRLHGFRSLDPSVADDFFLSIRPRDQLELLMLLPEGERRLWLRLLPPDDVADLIQTAPERGREPLLVHLDDATRREVRALLAYAEDQAGG